MSNFTKNTTDSHAIVAAMSAAAEASNTSGDNVLNALLQSLQSETPKIDQSIKNLLSIILADPTTHQEYLTHNIAFQCAKIFLKSLSSFVLLSIEDFSVEFPQVSQQSALQRLDEICQYKAIYAYYTHIQQHSSSQIKVSKLFGCNFFLWSRQWQSLKDFVLLNAQQQPDISLEQIEYFLTLYEKSIFTTDLRSNDADLIWATQFEVALRTRQQQRIDIVQKRLDDVEHQTKDELISLIQAVQTEERDPQSQEEDEEESRVEELAG